MSDVGCQDDAAYALGVLPAAQARAFEAHTATCARCQESASDLSGLLPLLDRVGPDDLHDADGPPDAGLPVLLRRVRRERRRARMLAGAAGLAAAAVVAAVVLTLPSGSSAPPAQAMTGTATSPVHASLALVDEPWGTRLDLRCRYDAGTRWGGRPRYDLVVTDRGGASRRVASWTVVPDRPATITGSVEWSARDISSVTVRLPDGTAVLRLDR